MALHFYPGGPGGIEDNVKPSIKSAADSIDSARTILYSGSIPSRFSYSSELRNFLRAESGDLANLKEEVQRIYNWLDERIDSWNTMVESIECPYIFPGSPVEHHEFLVQRALTKHFAHGDQVLLAEILSRAETVRWGDDAIPARGEYMSYQDIDPDLVFEIIDLRTGIRFNAYRGEGGNHMDVTPASPADAEIFANIEQCWDHRPIVVVYGDRVLKATMMPMGHGNGLPDVGFSGHFCIHFPGSTTHSSGEVAPTHRSAFNEIEPLIQDIISEQNAISGPPPPIEPTPSNPTLTSE